MSRINAHRIREREQLLVQAVVEHAGKLLRSESPGEVRTADVADEQCIAGEHRERLRRFFVVGEQQAHAFNRMSGSFKHAQTCVAYTQLESIGYADMRKRSARLLADVDFCAGAARQLHVPGNEIGM